MSLFCKHIYKTTTLEFAYDKWINMGSIIAPYCYDNNVKVYVATYKCLKCGKIKKEDVHIYRDDFGNSHFL